MGGLRMSLNKGEFRAREKKKVLAWKRGLVKA